MSEVEMHATLVINKIIENGVTVDQMVRSSATYCFVTIDELKCEIFAIITDMLIKQKLPLIISQRISWYYLTHIFKSDLFDSITNNTTNYKGETVYKRDELMWYCRNEIPNILRKWVDAASEAAKHKANKHSTLSLDTLNTSALKYYHTSIKNKRRTLEDRVAIFKDLNIFYENEPKQTHALFAVLDGHAGTEAVNYVSAHLPLSLVLHETYEDDISNAFYDTFRAVNRRLLHKSHVEHFKSGTTCSLALIKDKKLYVAWCGDSQICLVKNFKEFYTSSPHKPSDDREKKRIEEAGGSVIYHAGEYRVDGNISIARSFGDAGLDKYIISDPEIYSFELDGSEDYMIIGCDGVWSDMDTEEMVTIVNEALKSDENADLSEILVQRAKTKGSTDNITCIVVVFNEDDTIKVSF